MRKILFIHQNFPGQFYHISKYLTSKFDVHSMSFSNRKIDGITHHQCFYYSQNKLEKNNLSLEFETKSIRAKIVSDKCLELKKNDFYPDIIIAHSGWGESLLLKNIWCNVKLISYMELYYVLEDSMSIEMKNKLTMRNAPYLLSIVDSDYCVTPTVYQKNTFPKILQKKIKIIFEGIDTNFFKRKKINKLKIGFSESEEKWKYKIMVSKKDINSFDKNYTLDREKDNIITFVTRDLTPIRGYDTFLKSLPKVLETFPDTYVIIVGNDGYSYMNQPNNGDTYLNIYWNQIKDKIKNKDRIFFMGRVSQQNLVKIFSISTVNIYISEPFCLSWSFMEALSTGVRMVTSNNKPMTDIVRYKKEALLFDKKNPDNLSKIIIKILKEPKEYDYLRKLGRKLIKKKYDLYKVSIPKYEEIINRLLKKTVYKKKVIN